MGFAALCGCGCRSVVTFESQEEVQVSSGAPNAFVHAGSAAGDLSTSAEALLLVFQRLPVKELCCLVTAVSKPWQSAAAAALASQLITVGVLKAGSAKTASFAAWMGHYSSHICDLHIYHTDISTVEWTAVLGNPYPKLSRLELNRCRLTTAELSLVMQLTGLKELTLNSTCTQPEVSVIRQLSSSLTNLTKLELKSCDIGGEHLQGLTPLVQANLASLNLFDNPAIGADVESSNTAFNMWAAALGASEVATLEGLPGLREPDQTQVTAIRRRPEDARSPITEQVQQQLDHPAQQDMDTCSPGTTAATTQTNPGILASISASKQCSADDGLHELQQQHIRCPIFGQLHQLQLSYCKIQHLPALSQLTSLTSLDLRENRCDAETVQAVGQLQQLQELVLEEAIASNVPPTAYAALSALTNLELLDISGGPAGCLDMLLEPPTGVTSLPAPTQDKTVVATNGWHGLRVKWSGKGRAPLGFRLPASRRSSSAGGATSSPRVSRGSCRTSRESMSARCSRSPKVTSDSVIDAAEVLRARMSGDDGVELSNAAARLVRSAEGRASESGAATQVTSHAALQLALTRLSRAGSDADDALARRLSAAGSIPEEPLSSICEPPLSYDLFPRLRRLEAEQLGLTDADVASIVNCCSQLQELDISGNRVGPDGIAKLRELTTLTHLNISMQQPALADTAAGPLMQLKNLRGLDVGGNTFSKAVEVQLQHEGSGAGGRLTRLTGCGMRSEVHEPWVQIALDRQNMKHHEKTVGGPQSPRAIRTLSLDSTAAASPRAVKTVTTNASRANKPAAA